MATAMTGVLYVCLSLVVIVFARPGLSDGEYEQYILDRLFLEGLKDYPNEIVDRVRANDEIRIDQTWPSQNIKVGQVGGVAVDRTGDVYIFHRGEHVWEHDTFSNNNIYQKQNQGAIRNATIMKLRPNGDIIESFGENKYYMPHGLTVDGDGNLWITDVALHQVMKIPAGSHEPTLKLGQEFVPGSDDNHFCKPTDVAVASNGDFFVADGYCNSRIMKFSKDGSFLTEWGKKSAHPGNMVADDEFLVPHSLSLSEGDDVICVADREHGRTECFEAGLTNNTVTGKSVKKFENDLIEKVYAIDLVPSENALYLVSGPLGNAYLYKIDLLSGSIIYRAEPPQGFAQPHDLAVSPDGSIYTGEIILNRVLKFRN